MAYSALVVIRLTLDMRTVWEKIIFNIFWYLQTKGRKCFQRFLGDAVFVQVSLHTCTSI